MRLTALLSLLFVLVLPTNVIAQNNPGDSGRLSDGRAYRVDNNGFKIVDHVAELEVTIDDLNKQIRELESQMDERDGFSDETGFKEENLLVENTEVDSFQINPSSCQGELEKISILENQLALMQKQTNSSEHALVEELTNLKSQQNSKNKEIKSLKDHIAKLQSALMESPSEESFAKQVQSKEGLEKKLKVVSIENEKMTEELSSLKSELEEKENTQKELTQKMTDMTSQIAKLRDSLDAYGKKGQSRARFRTVLSERDAVKRNKRTVAKATVDSTTLRRAQREFRASLSRISKLISQRKNHFDKARKVKAIAVSPQKLVSKKGLSLDKLKSRISKLHAGSNISTIRQGLYDIEKILKEDIKVATNLAKL